MRLIWLFALCVLHHPGSAFAAESVTVPGYTPATGVEHSYRSQKSAETDLSIWFDKPGAAAIAIQRGDFRQRMTVLSKDANNMRVRWRLSAELPPDATGPADAYQMNIHYRNSLSAYGVHELEFETDLNGAATSLIGFDRILQNMEAMVSSGPDGTPVAPDNLLSGIIERLKADPLFAAEILVPEANLLASGQSSEAGTFEIGQSWETSVEQDINGVQVPVTATWKVEAADPAEQTATFSWNEAYDATSFTRAQQQSIDKMIAGFGERASRLTSEQLASVKSATKGRTGTMVISLKDGSTIEVTEIVAAEAGGMKTVVKTHVMREDHSAE